MTLRYRILLYYCVTLGLTLLVVGYRGMFELAEQRELVLRSGVSAATHEDPLWEAAEIVLFGGFPAIVLSIVGGALLMKRSLRPLEDLTRELEKTDATNLSQVMPRSGNGDELDRMTAVFNTMKERLGHSFTQVREFTLHASHELKTPLTIMHGTLESLLSDAQAPTHCRECAASLLEEVQRLSRIVGQLTFLAKADARLLSAAQDDVRLDELVRDVTEDLTILAASSDISVTLSICDEATVRGDRMRLRQMLLNLADNSVKHNQKGGNVSLSLRHKSGQATIEIVNTGPVLPAALRGRVFERFFRANTEAGAEVDGCGLGLSIAQSIAQSHEGNIAMDATAAGLNRVVVTLPATAA